MMSTLCTRKKNPPCSGVRVVTGRDVVATVVCSVMCVGVVDTLLPVTITPRLPIIHRQKTDLM